MSYPPPLPSDSDDAPYLQAYSGNGTSNRASGCLIGCLVAIAVCLATGAVGFYVLYFNFRGLATRIVSKAVEEAVRQSPIPAEEKVAIRAQIQRVLEAYRKGDISYHEVVVMMEDLATSPIFLVALIRGIDAKFIQPSELSSDEKTASERTLMRIMRGAIEGSLNADQLQQLANHFLDSPAAEVAWPENEGDDSEVQAAEAAEDTREHRIKINGRTMRSSLSDDELRAFLEDANTMANAATVPDEDYEVQYSEHIRRVIDKALSQSQ